MEVESDVDYAGDGDGPDNEEDDGTFVDSGVVYLLVLRTPPEIEKACWLELQVMSMFQPTKITVCRR